MRLQPSSVFRLLAGLLASILLSACQHEQDRMVEESGHLFVFNYREGTAHYLVTLRKLSPIPEGATAVAEFEDPAGGQALVATETVFTVADGITLQSPFIIAFCATGPIT